MVVVPHGSVIIFVMRYSNLGVLRTDNMNYSIFSLLILF